MFKNKYIALWLLLALALVIIIGFAFYEDVSFGSYTVKKAPVAELFFPNDSLNSENNKEKLAKLDSIKNAESQQHKVDSMPQSIFIFGDSMTLNLALRLADYAKQNGHTINSVNWDSSSTITWANSDTLSYFIKKFKPTHIFISLGSNELYLKKPETRLAQVKKILQVIDTIPYTWIGPPNWAKDLGFNDMLALECAPGTFFRSEGMEFQRKADKRHPTRESSANWVDSIMRWLPKSAHPFIAEYPSDTIGKSNANTIFLKPHNK